MQKIKSVFNKIKSCFKNINFPPWLIKISKIIVKLLKFWLIGFLYIYLLFGLPVHGLFRILIFIGVLYVKHLYSNRPLRKKNDVIRLWFGVPGSGKTTMAAYITKLRLKKDVPVFSNVDVKGTYILDPLKDLGHYNMDHGEDGATVIIDEASIDLDCRDFKSFPESAKRFFALHRHERTEVHVFSQAIDIDKKIRDRAICCFYLQKSILPFHVSYRKIKKMITINEEKQLLDGFDFVPLSRHLIFSPPLWKMFNTLDRSMCPTKEKDWQKWGETNNVSTVEKKEKATIPTIDIKI